MGEDYLFDIFMFGKVVGGGMFLVVLGGCVEVMDLLVLFGFVY